jgi:hypothetical protein
MGKSSKNLKGDNNKKEAENTEKNEFAIEIAALEKSYFLHLSKAREELTDDESKLCIEVCEQIAEGENAVKVLKDRHRSYTWLWKKTSASPALLQLFLSARYMYSLKIVDEIVYIADEDTKKAFTNQYGESVQCAESVRRVDLRIQARKFEASRIQKTLKFMRYFTSLRERAEMIMDFAMRGEIMSSDAKELMDIVKTGSDVIRTADIDERLAKLEEAAGKSSKDEA